MTREAIDELKKYTLGKNNTEKVEINVLKLNRIIKALEQEPCDDAISRKDFIAKIEDIYDGYMLDDSGCYPQNFVDLAEEMPSVKPQYTEAEIQKIQELEQAQLEKAYEIGKAEQCDIIVDEIMMEIECQKRWLFRAGYTACNIDIAFDFIKNVVRRAVCGKE